MPSNYFLRVIATLRHYSQIVSDILSGSIYMAYIYIYSDIRTDILSGIYSDILCGILSGTFSDIHSGSFWHIVWYSLWHSIRSGIYSAILFGILFDIVIGILFGILSGRRGPLHQHLAIWGSGPCMAHCIRSWWYGVRVTRHSKGGEEDKRRRRRRRSSTFVEIYIETLTWQAEEIFYMVQ